MSALVAISDPVIRMAKKEDMDQVYQVRYQSYLNAGLMQPNDSGRLKDRYDSSDYTKIFVAVSNGRIIGTIRLIFDSKYGLPMDEEARCSSFMRFLRKQKRRIAEVGKYAFLPDYQLNSRKLLLDLDVWVLKYAISAGVHDLVILAVSHHSTFYEKFFLFEKLADFYSSQYYSQLVGLRLNLDNIEERYREEYSGRRLDLYAKLSAPQMIDEYSIGPGFLRKCAS